MVIGGKDAGQPGPALAGAGLASNGGGLRIIRTSSRRFRTFHGEEQSYGEGMKRLAPLILLATLCAFVVAPFAFAAAKVPAPVPAAAKSTPARDPAAPVAPIATAISTVTGMAISPLLGTSAYGAFRWFSAKDEADRATLPWFAQMNFWLPALLLVGVCAGKDLLGTVLPPGAKKPLDVLETVENKVSGLVAAGAVVPFTVSSISKILISETAAPGTLSTGGLAMIHFAGIDWAPVLNVLTVPFGIAMFALVWMASHAINALILLSPWGAIDAVLKTARTALLGLLTIAATLNPWVGAALSLALVVVAYFVAGWAFRLTVFGAVFSWDFFTRRRARFVPPENDNEMFSGSNLTTVPVRTYGRLVQRTQGGLEFHYRPWLVLAPRSVPVTAAPASLAVGQGMFFSDVVDADDRTLFSLPPRYRGHEEAVARAYAMGRGVQPAGLRKAWSALRDMLGGRATQPAAA